MNEELEDWLKSKPSVVDDDKFFHQFHQMMVELPDEYAVEMLKACIAHIAISLVYKDKADILTNLPSREVLVHSIRRVLRLVELSTR